MKRTLGLVRFTRLVWYLTIIILFLSLPVLVRPLFSVSEISSQAPLGNTYWHYLLSFLWVFSVIPVIIILYQLKEIAKTLANNKPFTEENPHRLRIMGYSMFVIDALFILFTLYHTISTYLMYKGTNIRVYMWNRLTLTAQSPLANVILFFVIGCILLIMASIFEEAVLIKKDNDLTI